MVVTTTHAFCELLKKSRLLSSAQVAEFDERVAAGGGEAPGPLADEMVARGLLTDWQARQLLAGRHAFFIGKYKLLERLGGGGMGVVFKAHHPMTGRTVALKVMTRALLSNSSAAARFQREVRLICALNHPNIITAYDADCVNGTSFLVMEYGMGRDLRSWLKEHGPLPVAWACECARQAALGLQHAHERGLVHRDIKPENLLVEGDPSSSRPTVKILDLGLARLLDEESHEDSHVTETGQILGTPDYIAPEQAEDLRRADIRSDIFSLGCTLFRALTGQFPFPGDDAVQKLMARLSHDAPLVSSARADVPPGLDAVVARMLARRPDDRYQTPAEVAQALLPFTADAGMARPEARAFAAAPRDGQSTRPTMAGGSTGAFLDELATQTASGPAATLLSAPSPPSFPSAQPPPAAAKPVLLTPPVVVPPAARPVISVPTAYDAGRYVSRRPAARYDRKNWLLGAALGVAVALPIVAALFWTTRPATLVLDWPTDQRSSSRLDVDGRPMSVPSGNPAKINLEPGEHRVVLRRRGYEQIEWELSVTRGSTIRRPVEWHRLGFARPSPEEKQP